MARAAESTARPSTIYGPVRSWRFGQSLGIDPICEVSTCSFNCIYCQLGRIQRITTERREYVPTARVEHDLAGVDWSVVDVVTLSGSGEPTLATNLPEIVAAVRRHAGPRPIHLLSNATLFHLPEVRAAVREIDVVACKLDAPDEATLRRMNRPAAGVTLEGIVEGILALRREFPGRLALQIMFMPANVHEIEGWAPLVRRIRPDEIQLNTPRRPYPLDWRIENRGNHDRTAAPDRERRLKVISREEAAQAEHLLRRSTGIELISVYRD